MGKCQLFHIIIYNTYTFRLISLTASYGLYRSWISFRETLTLMLLTLCDPIDSSPPGSSVPGILQARILEWVAISFSNACMHAKLLQSCLILLTLILEGNYQTLIFLSHLIFLIKLNFYIQIQACIFQAWKWPTPPILFNMSLWERTKVKCFLHWDLLLIISLSMGTDWMLSNFMLLTPERAGWTHTKDRMLSRPMFPSLPSFHLLGQALMPLWSHLDIASLAPFKTESSFETWLKIKRNL